MRQFCSPFAVLLLISWQRTDATRAQMTAHHRNGLTLMASLACARECGAWLEMQPPPPCGFTVRPLRTHTYWHAAAPWPNDCVALCIALSSAGTDDPTQRVAMAIWPGRLYIRCTHSYVVYVWPKRHVSRAPLRSAFQRLTYARTYHAVTQTKGRK
jgi:hypothetical protein